MITERRMKLRLRIIPSLPPKCVLLGRGHYVGLKNVEEATGKLENILKDMAFMETTSTILGPLKEV